MSLRSLTNQNATLLVERPLQGGPEQWERPEALEPAQAGLDVQQGGGQPALLLVGGPPAVHLGDALGDQTVQGFETVRGLQADPQLGEEAEPMQRQRLLQPFVETPDGRLVQQAEFRPAAAEPGLRFAVRVGHS